MSSSVSGMVVGGDIGTDGGGSSSGGGRERFLVTLLALPGGGAFDAIAALLSPG